MADQVKTLAEIRKEYSRKELLENDVDPDPIRQFQVWLDEAVNSQLYEPTAMALSTADKNGKPTCRIVLLKGVDPDGFLFFTNYKSRKAKELDENPYACLTFFWPELERQLRIEGVVKRTSREESEAYFQSRPRDSQIGALISPQSNPITRAELVSKKKEAEDEFQGQDIQCPSFWGGYRVVPIYFEYWQGRPGRLHDRIVYSKEGKAWEIKRIAP